MMHFTHAIGASLLGCVLSVLLTTPSHAVDVRTQGPCPLTLDACNAFDFDDLIPIIRTISFSMSGAGKALVRFDGTMVCLSQSTTADEIVILNSQIVTSAAAVATFAGPGGNSHQTIFHRIDSGAFGVSTTFNLASARLIAYASGGPKTVFLKLNRLRMDVLTRCVVKQAAFIVETFP